MTFLDGFIVGIMIGGSLDALIMAFMIVASDADDEDYSRWR